MSSAARGFVYVLNAAINIHIYFIEKICYNYYSGKVCLRRPLKMFQNNNKTLKFANLRDFLETNEEILANRQ